MWKAIGTIRTELAAGLDRKISTKLFTFVISSIIVLAIAASAFQWDAIANNKNETKEDREAIREKLSQVREDMSAIKALMEKEEKEKERHDGR